MSRDDILRLLQECGFGTLMDHPIMTENMMRFAALAAAEEREACAKIIDEIAERYKEQSDATYWALRDAAFLIKNRKKV